jgi:hypothetical protein
MTNSKDFAGWEKEDKFKADGTLDRGDLLLYIIEKLETIYGLNTPLPKNLETLYDLYPTLPKNLKTLYDRYPTLAKDLDKKYLDLKNFDNGGLKDILVENKYVENYCYSVIGVLEPLSIILNRQLNKKPEIREWDNPVSFEMIFWGIDSIRANLVNYAGWSENGQCDLYDFPCFRQWNINFNICILLQTVGDMSISLSYYKF